MLPQKMHSQTVISGVHFKIAPSKNAFQNCYLKNIFQKIHFKTAFFSSIVLKSAATDMRKKNYKKNFSLIWQVVFELWYIFCQERTPLLSLNKLGEKSWATKILGKFVNKP